MLKLSVCLWVCAALIAGQPIASAAQSAKKVEPATGIVTGQVSCADTNAPARFAIVTLEPVPPEKAERSETDKKAASAAAPSLSETNATATTDLEGRFVLDKVAPGRYYVIGSLPGYLNPLTRFDADQLDTFSEETRKELAKSVPIVDVEPNQPASVTLRLEHASEVSGTVLYDDGSPAVGLHMQLMRKKKDGTLAEPNSDFAEGMGMFGSHATADDRGHYRMIGAPPGEYVIKATLPSNKVSVGGLLGGRGFTVSVTGYNEGALTVYSGDTFRKRDAKSIKVGEGEQVGGQDITIPLAGLHTIRGTVTAKRDGHGINSANIELLYADDREKVRSVRPDDDGSYELEYVPADKYILRVTGAGDSEKTESHSAANTTYFETRVVRHYADAEIALTVVGDMTGVELAAPDPPAKSAPQP